MKAVPYTPKVRNRSELRRVLEDSLLSREEEVDSPYAKYQEDEDKGSLKPKTYLIESNAGIDKMRTNGYTLEPSEDDTLWNLRCLDRETPFIVYLDKLDKRYWMVHSTYYATPSDEVVYNLVSKNGSQLDYLWLASDALDYLGQGRQSTGFGLSYSNLFAAEEDRPHVSMRYWGRGEVPSVLKGLRRISELKNQVSLTNIGIRHKTDAGYVKEDIYQKGKLTARSGDSIDSHFNLIDTVKEYYSGIIREIEQDYTLRYEYLEHSCKLDGTYSVIKFSKEVRDLRSFANVLTAGGEPFRIWGIWRPISDNHIKINGIDQHTKTPVELELMPDEIRVILGEGSCGNLVTRLFTNIQVSFDSDCQLIGLNNADLIRAH